MLLKDFLKEVDVAQVLECKGIIENPDIQKDEVLIEYTPSNSLFKVNVDTILKNSWNELESVLTEKREPVILDHMTRIVGYFSKVKNWNKSKLGELKDRQAGNYNLSQLAS